MVTKIPLRDGVSFLQYEEDDGSWVLYRYYDDTGDLYRIRRLDEFETEFVECALESALEPS